MKKHKEFLEYTINLAENNVNNSDGGPFAAILVKNNKIISEATNAVIPSSDPTAHAEIQVIRKLAKEINDIDLSQFTLYSSCRPCPMCLGAIYWSNIKNIYYAADSDDAEKANFSDKFIYSEFQKEENLRMINIHHIDIQSKLIPFETWNKKENKKKY